MYPLHSYLCPVVSRRGVCQTKADLLWFLTDQYSEFKVLSHQGLRPVSYTLNWRSLVSLVFVRAGWADGKNLVPCKCKSSISHHCQKYFLFLLFRLSPHPLAQPVCRPCSCRGSGPGSSSGSPGSTGSSRWEAGSTDSNLMIMNE